MQAKNVTKVTAEPGKQELFIEREFNAPRELVFKAHTQPDLLVKWLGPKGLSMTIDYFDARNGGSYRYVHTDANGNSYAFNGTFHELSIDRMIQTFEFEGLPERGHVSLDCMQLHELPGNRTRITIQSIFRSVADRDGLVQSGMERGMSEGHMRLDELIAQGF